MSSVACGPCEYDGTARTARKWCISCEEGLCEDCEKVHKSHKGLRDHSLLSIEDYRKLAGVEIRQSCEEHGNKFDWYCKTHEEALCVDCVSSIHKTCTDIIPLKDACKDVKKSTALVDLEESIYNATENIKYCIEDRSKAIDTIEKESREIKRYIQDIKQKLNKHLDDLEQKLLVEVRTKLDACKSKSDTVLKRLNSNAKRVKQLETQSQQIKTFAADHQLFLGIRQINRAVVEEINSTKAALKDCINYKFELKLDASVSSFQKIITQLGKLTVKEMPTTLSVREAKIDQAQIQVRVPSTTISNIRLQLKQKFNIKQKGEPEPITGCIILPDNRILVADCLGTGKLMDYNDNGQYIRDIPVSGGPWDVTVIDSDRIAVSYRGSDYIEIINIKHNKVQKKIDFGSYCCGISHQDGKLYVIVFMEGIVVTDMTGNILHQIKRSGTVYHITTTKDKIFYTDWEEDTIHCCSMEGEEIWTFNDESIINPRGISVDNNQNVYVVGRDSNNLTLIQHDGTVSKTLLTKDDGLKRPLAVYYRKDTNTLMIGDKPGSVALYSVT